MGSRRNTVTAAMVACALALALVAPRAAEAAGKLDIRSWLNRPGVKVVAVEFYATWCKPCMEAVPRWKALHEKYYEDGFRLIVVNTLDPGGGCAQVPWNPDERLCDDDGFIANSFGIGGNLPSAYIWTWQGNLLVRKGHIELAEKEVARYLAKNPRVSVEGFGANGKPDELLELAVRGEVQMTGKFEVVVSPEERERLKKIRKESHNLGGRADHQCTIGAEVSANALLVAKLIGSGRDQKLSLSLNSAETGCLLASTYVSYSEKRGPQAVREAVAALTGKLRREPEHPKGGTFGEQAGPVRVRPTVQEGKIGGGDTGEWDPNAGAAQQAVVKFRSNPAGAVVLVDGRVICTSTPCSKALEPGRYNVDMQLNEYVPKKEVVDVKSNETLVWELAPDFATVTVQTTPGDLTVNVDGKDLSGSALRNMRLSPGAHEVVIDNRCYPKTGERIVVKRGETRTLSFAPPPRPSAIQVMAEDEKGNVIEAKVSVDGQLQQGTTPRTYKVPVCSKQVKVEADGKAPFEQNLTLEEKKVLNITAKLQTGVKVNGYAHITVRGDSSLPVQIDGVSVPSYKRNRYQVKAGATRVTVQSSCVEPYAHQVFINPGGHTTVEVKPTPRTAKLNIKATDDKGAALLGALVFVDNTYVGTAPGVLEVPACGRNLEVHKDDLRPYTYRLSMTAGQEREMTAKLYAESSSYSRNRQKRKIAGWMRSAGKTYDFKEDPTVEVRSSSSERSGHIALWSGLDLYNNDQFYDQKGDAQDISGKYSEMPITIGAGFDLAEILFVYGQMRYLSATSEASSGTTKGSGIGDVRFGVRFSGAGWRWDLGMNYDLRKDEDTPAGELPISDKWHTLFLGVSKSFYLSEGFSFGVGVDINTFLEREIPDPTNSSADPLKATAGTLANVWVESSMSVASSLGVGVRLGRLGQANTMANETEVDNTGGSMWYLTPWVSYSLARSMSVRLAMEHQGVYTNWGIPLSGENQFAGYGLLARLSLRL